MVARDEGQSHLAQLLAVERFRDYGPNGLQVEGRGQVHRLITGVTASQALIEAAVQAGADAILVHHGLFWRGQDGRVTGWMRARLAALLAHGISLFAYHLPLGAHAELGNNAQFGARLVARETGVAFVACGHHATERFGAPAVGAHLAATFGLEHRFIDIDNPA